MCGCGGATKEIQRVDSATFGGPSGATFQRIAEAANAPNASMFNPQAPPRLRANNARRLRPRRIGCVLEIGRQCSARKLMSRRQSDELETSARAPRAKRSLASRTTRLRFLATDGRDRSIGGAATIGRNIHFDSSHGPHATPGRFGPTAPGGPARRRRARLPRRRRPPALFERRAPSGTKLQRGRSCVLCAGRLRDVAGLTPRRRGPRPLHAACEPTLCSRIPPPSRRKRAAVGRSLRGHGDRAGTLFACLHRHDRAGTRPGWVRRTGSAVALVERSAPHRPP